MALIIYIYFLGPEGNAAGTFWSHSLHPDTLRIRRHRFRAHADLCYSWVLVGGSTSEPGAHAKPGASPGGVAQEPHVHGRLQEQGRRVLENLGSEVHSDDGGQVGDKVS